MAEMRCPIHDLIFETTTDQRKPGSSGMPANGHTDCPLCKRGAGVVKIAQTGKRKIG